MKVYKKSNITILIVFFLITLILISCVLINIHYLVQSFYKHKENQLYKKIEVQYRNNNDFENWAKTFVKDNNIVEFSIIKDNRPVYSYKLRENKINKSMLLLRRTYEFDDQKLGHLEIIIWINPGEIIDIPFILLISTIAIFMIILCIVLGTRFIRNEIFFMEMLGQKLNRLMIEHGRLFRLNNKKSISSQILVLVTQLLNDLQKEKKNTNKLDLFIKQKTFFDETTNLPNKLFFENKLRASIDDKDKHGAYLLLDMFGLDTRISNGNDSAHNLLIIDNIISKKLEKFNNTLLSRYSKKSFAALILMQSEKEVIDLCRDIFNKLEGMRLVENEHWFNFGVVFFQHGEKLEEIYQKMDECINICNYQRANNWHIFKNKKLLFSKSNLEWRTIFSEYLKYHNLIFSGHSFFEILENSPQALNHIEVVTSLRYRSEIIKPSYFIPKLIEVGLNRRLDMYVVNYQFSQIKKYPEKNISINLTSTSLKNKYFSSWLKFKLLELSSSERKQAFYEIHENEASNFDPLIKKALFELQKFNCNIIIDQVGRNIVDLDYLNYLPINFLKIDKERIISIKENNENQYFIKSLLGICRDKKIKIIANGVKNKEDYDFLKNIGVFITDFDSSH